MVRAKAHRTEGGKNKARIDSGVRTEGREKGLALTDETSSFHIIMLLIFNLYPRWWRSCCSGGSIKRQRTSQGRAGGKGREEGKKGAKKGHLKAGFSS